MRIDKVYRDGPVWRGDVSGPISNYPATGLLVADDSEIPEPEPPPLLTPVDNTDTRFVYSGAWYSGPTTAPGFYSNTIAYSSIAGNTAILIFNGTSIEVFCEKKSGHGSGTFQVDSQPPTTVNLGVPGPVGSTSVFKVDVPDGEHTIKLGVVGNGYVVFDYVKINGSPVTPPVPPVGDIVVNPGQSIKAAVESATAGKTVLISDGGYFETNIKVPLGVNVKGASKTGVIISYPGTAQSQGESALFEFKGGITGNQMISDLTIDGNYALNGGIIVDSRNDVKILNVSVKECTFFGSWLKNAVNAELANSEFYNTSWASTGWASGEVCLFNVTNVAIHHNYIHTDRNDKGYAIKALWDNGFVSGKIYSNNMPMAATSLWNSGSSPNIGIELHNCYYAGIEIYDNDIINPLSLAAHRPTKSGRVIVRKNRFKMLPVVNGAIELVCSNVTIEENTIEGDAIFTANYQPNGKWVDQIVNNNDFTSDGSNPGWGGTFLIGPDGANMTITNNRFKNLGSYPFVKHMGNPANSTVVDSGNVKN